MLPVRTDVGKMVPECDDMGISGMHWICGSSTLKDTEFIDAFGPLRSPTLDNFEGTPFPGIPVLERTSELRRFKYQGGGGQTDCLQQAKQLNTAHILVSG